MLLRRGGNGDEVKESERDNAFEFILKVSVSLSSEIDQKRVENVRLESGDIEPPNTDLEIFDVQVRIEPM